MKKNSGITILALIITIIILIILAIVSVSLVINSGILNKSEQGVNTYSKEEELEQLKLVIASAKLKGNGFLTTENLNSELKNKFGENKETIPKKDYWEFNGYNIYKDGKVEEFNSILPKEYQQVEYIESTGTQWISTSYIPTVTEDMKIELEYMFTAQQTGDSFLFGSKNNGAAVQCQKYSHARWYCASGTYNFRNLLSSCGGELNKKYSLIMDKNLLTIDGQSVNNTSTTSGDAVPLYIFAGNWNGKTQFINTGARIYKLTFTANGILEANFIPCYKKAENSENNKPGLYNLVEGKFYTNKGTVDDFIAGNDIY